MDATEVLVAMLERFRDGKRWTQFTEARTASLRKTGPGHRDAQSWCLAGAIHAELLSLPFSQRFSLEQQVRKRLHSVTGMESLVLFNDAQPNFGPVRAALLAAIEDGK